MTKEKANEIIERNLEDIKNLPIFSMVIIRNNENLPKTDKMGFHKSVKRIFKLSDYKVGIPIKEQPVFNHDYITQ